MARSQEGIYICQRNFVLDLLVEIGKLGYKPAATPIELNHDLTGQDGANLSLEESGLN